MDCIVPKKHVGDFLDMDDVTLSKVKNIARKRIRQEKLEDKGYRLGINGGGAQIIDHFHVHLLGPMGKLAKM